MWHERGHSSLCPQSAVIQHAYRHLEGKLHARIIHQYCPVRTKGFSTGKLQTIEDP